VTAVLSVGSNLGDRLGHLRLAVEALAPYAVSPVYESAPVGGVEQGDFLNAVLLCELDATAAWTRAQGAEAAAGRRREVRWGPRTLDVDVVLADGGTVAMPLEVAPWGDAFGQLVDKYGISWMVNIARSGAGAAETVDTAVSA